MLAQIQMVQTVVKGEKEQTRLGEGRVRQTIKCLLILERESLGGPNWNSPDALNTVLP